MRCRNVQQAVAVYSDSKLLLFVQLKKMSASSLHSHLISSSSLSSDVTPLPTAELSSTNNHQKHSVSAQNDDGRNDEDDKSHLTADEADCNELATLLRQWLAGHCQPDDVEVIDRMPFTKHGKFLLSLASLFCRVPYHYCCMSFSWRFAGAVPRF